MSIKKLVVLIAAVELLTVSAMAQTARHEAESATLSGGAEVVTLADASGGSYVNMKGGDLTFSVTAGAAGFYTIYAQYAQTCDDNKIQNLVVNGAVAGTVGFPATGGGYDVEASTCGPLVFKSDVIVSKVTLKSGVNAIAITNSWGWVNIDYIEVGPYEATSFTLSSNLVTPNASANAHKVYQFLRENFQKKVISGVMSDPGDVMKNLTAIENIPEVAHIRSSSGDKTPALIGFDLMQGIGKEAADRSSWGYDYTMATIRLAKDLFGKGGIPIYCWHWRDPSRATNEFYTKDMTFDISKAFPNGAAATSSDEYKAIMRDIDSIAVWYLKPLADDNIPILWRPLHEAAGGWFWWGAKSGASNRALWIAMFDRLTGHHKLDNLIWVWTCEESGPPLAWYPGDEYVDIIGRDYYPNPNQREDIKHLSLVSNFENIKNIYGGRKIIALSENGSVPHPDSLVAHGAQWSFFMPWYGDFTTSVNPASHWQKVMNHDYVITLDEMPGWGKYNLTAVSGGQGGRGQGTDRVYRGASQKVKVKTNVSVRGKTLNVTSLDNSEMSIRLIDVRGKVAARFTAVGKTQHSLTKIPAGRYVVETRVGGKRVGSSAVVVK